MSTEQVNEILDDLYPGDVVRLSHAINVTTVTDVVRMIDDRPVLESMNVFIRPLLDDGFNLSILSRVQEPEPGIYFDRHGDVWAFPPESEYGRDTRPRMIALPNGTPASYEVTGWRDFAPFTRIEKY